MCFPCLQLVCLFRCFDLLSPPTLLAVPPELRDLPQPKLNTESYDADMVTAEVRPTVCMLAACMHAGRQAGRGIGGG